MYVPCLLSDHDHALLFLFLLGTHVLLEKIKTEVLEMVCQMIEVSVKMLELQDLKTLVDQSVY